MTKTIAAITTFIDAHKQTQKGSNQLSLALTNPDLSLALQSICSAQAFQSLFLALIESPAFSADLSREFAAANAVSGLSACRNLRSALSFSLDHFFSTLSQLISAFDEVLGRQWMIFADKIHTAQQSQQKLLTYLTESPSGSFYQNLAERLIEENPHAIYPTSSFRESSGYVESTPDNQTIEAIVQFKTFTTIKIVDHTLDLEQTVLKDVYRSLNRCVCLVDKNVEHYYGSQIERYFQHHGIDLHKRVYRAMEVDKGIATVEKMLGDFKQLGVARNEPVLIVGGGVLADTGGLACALYHRNTPYVMLSTSIVAGIDAGPSPRTCCDGFGYKNLFGAYHPPILSITDRFFFKTLREGWLRHGIIEIVKMAVIKDAELFENLEKAQDRLISTRFGTLNCQPSDDIDGLSQAILGAALRSYVAAEYDNLYETHQCRPHAYGHTWSPGFEIEAGLLHGHAVAIGMGFGAYLSYRMNWISASDFRRVLQLISGLGLSLWHDILYQKEILWQSQQKIFQKRGQNLVAPLPKGKIGQCGYLNALSQAELYAAIDDYETICLDYPRGGRGIDPHCRDVGLEDPATVGQSVGQGVKSDINNGASNGIETRAIAAAEDASELFSAI